jgi:Mg2+-importing ATPase
MISLLTELAVVLVLRTRKPAFRSRPGRRLLLSTLAVTAVTFAIPFLGGASAIFGFVPLSTMELSTVALIAVGYLVATEAAKTWYFRDTVSSSLSTTLRPGGDV